MRFSGAASSSASRSCARSRSCASSTRRCWHRPLQVARSAPSRSSRRNARATRSSKSRPPRRRISASYAAYVRATGPASGSRSIDSASTSRSSLNRDRIVSKARRSALGRSGRTARMTSSRSSRGLTGSPAARSISRPRAWNVRIRTRVARPAPSGARADSIRSRSSSAARRLNVIAQIDSGSTPRSTSHAIRATSVVVLPDPAGATHSTGPGGAVAAARWSDLESRQAFDHGRVLGHRGSMPNRTYVPDISGAPEHQIPRLTGIPGNTPVARRYRGRSRPCWSAGRVK